MNHCSRFRKPSQMSPLVSETSVSETSRAMISLFTLCVLHVHPPRYEDDFWELLVRSSLPALLSPMHAGLPLVVVSRGSFGPVVLRSAWAFPIEFPENVVADRGPRTPPGTPPMSPRTPPGPPPGSPTLFAPMTPPELFRRERPKRRDGLRL